MKIHILFFGLLIGAFSFNATAKSITGEISLGQKESKFIYLYEYIGKNFFKKDSSLIDKKKTPYTFEFAVQQTENEVFRIGITPKESTEILYSNENIHVTISYNNGINFSSNSIVNTQFQQYRSTEASFAKEVKVLSNQLNAVQKSRASQQIKDSTQQSIISQYSTLLSARTLSFKNIYNETNNSLLKDICKLFILDTLNETNFITNNTFENEALMHGDFIYRKLELYLSSFGNVNNQNLIEKINYFFKYGPSNSLQRQVIYEFAILYAYQRNKDVATQYAENFIREYPVSKLALMYVDAFSPMIGMPVTDIELFSPEGIPYKLSDLKGQVILLDFWASWCGPCRRENPVVVAAYEKFKDKGFTVYSVSLDKDKSRWLAAIRQDNLTWPYHVSELKGWNGTVSKAYKVSGIPASFLIGKDGTLIARNLRGHALETKLKEVLGE